MSNNTTKHTPGEWKVKDLKSHGIMVDWQIESNGTHIATLNPYAPEESHTEANAALIAAAPDMYEALKLIHDAILQAPVSKKSYSIENEKTFISIIKEVLNKANQ